MRLPGQLDQTHVESPAVAGDGEGPGRVPAVLGQPHRRARGPRARRDHREDGDAGRVRGQVLTGGGALAVGTGVGGSVDDDDDEARRPPRTAAVIEVPHDEARPGTVQRLPGAGVRGDHLDRDPGAQRTNNDPAGGIRASGQGEVLRSAGHPEAHRPSVGVHTEQRTGPVEDRGQHGEVGDGVEMWAQGRVGPDARLPGGEDGRFAAGPHLQHRGPLGGVGAGRYRDRRAPVEPTRAVAAPQRDPRGPLVTGGERTAVEHPGDRVGGARRVRGSCVAGRVSRPRRAGLPAAAGEVRCGAGDPGDVQRGHRQPLAAQSQGEPPRHRDEGAHGAVVVAPTTVHRLGVEGRVESEGDPGRAVPAPVPRGGDGDIDRVQVDVVAAEVIREQVQGERRVRARAVDHQGGCIRAHVEYRGQQAPVPDHPHRRALRELH